MLFGKLPTKIYYYVPPCPKCGSRVTGHYIASRRDNDQDWVILEALKHGEIAQLSYEVPTNNCFCLDCGFEWGEDVSASFKTSNYVKEQRAIRHTDELLRSYREEMGPKKRGFFASFR